MTTTAPTSVAASNGTATSLRLLVHRHVTEVTRARTTVAGWARSHGADRATDDLLLIVTELVTNAIEACRSHVGLTVTADGDHVIVEVEDDGPGMTPQTSRPQPRPSRWHTDGTRGRGLQLVQTLSDRLTVASSSRGATVRAAVHMTPAGREAR